MTARVGVGERQAWIGVVAMLATSIVWLAVINGALVVWAWMGRLDEFVVAARVLLRVARGFLPAVEAVLPVACLGMVLSGAVLAALWGGAKREVRHG